jgi:hypothetical protein
MVLRSRDPTDYIYVVVGLRAASNGRIACRFFLAFYRKSPDTGALRWGRLPC